MSSTQHQLIEQCVTRLRGIVEALDNIHDTSPQRWSTDLDDVHSSAESLLALINDQAPTLDSQGLALHTIAEYPCPEQDNMTAANMRQVAADAITGALAFGAQASQPPAEDHWLRPFYDIGRAEGQRTQELAMLVRMLASSLKRHAPESNLVARATNYLAAKGLAGTPLRDAPASVEQAEVERPIVSFEKYMQVMYDRDENAKRLDAAMARVAELEKQEPVATIAKVPGEDWNGLHFYRDLQGMQPGTKLYAAPVSQAQHSVPEGYALIPVRETEAMHDAVMALLYKGVARTDTQKLLDAYIAAAPGKEVPQAWLDVQAERRRQVEAEGWTPEHDDEHDSGEIACAAACYALPPAHPARIEGALGRYGRDPNIWPWTRDWWKPAPNDRRRELIKAGALVLAEIERLDRACISQSPQPGATTASS
ncbi:hypothetical protein [Pseudomonas aeruginosa]|uniref:hypothetical protein n=1 Tax=Pseudomonas aeruginosa TaxID=287 RepID=UPI0037702D3A